MLMVFLPQKQSIWNQNSQTIKPVFSVTGIQICSPEEGQESALGVKFCCNLILTRKMSVVHGLFILTILRSERIISCDLNPLVQ